MKIVSIDELKRNLSKLIVEVIGGEHYLVTRHRRPVARVSPAEHEHLHVGARAGRAYLKPLLNLDTRGRYLEVLQDDRRGQTQES